MPANKAVKRDLDDEGLEYAKKAKMTEMPLDQKRNKAKLAESAKKDSQKQNGINNQLA